MAVDLAALKASLVDRTVLEATSTTKFPTEDEATQDSIVLAAQTIWALIDDLEAANALVEVREDSIASLELANSQLTTELYYAENGDPRIQMRHPARGFGYPRRRSEERVVANGFPVFGPLET